MGRVIGWIIDIVVACSLTLLLWSIRGKGPTIHPDGETLLFRYSFGFRSISYVVAFVPPYALAMLPSFAPPVNEDGLWAILALYAFFVAFGIPLWWETTRFALYVNPVGLDCHSPWRGRHFIAWDDIAAVSFNLIDQWFVIRAKDGRKVFRVPIFVGGPSDFLVQCEGHLPHDALMGAKLGYDQVGRPFPKS